LAEIRETSPTGERRRGREYALQILYQIDLAPRPVDECLEEMWLGRQAKRGIVEFASRLARGAVLHREEIDAVLCSVSHHWRVPRMAVVDRNIMRLAVYEMLFEESTPRIVVINEAIEVAKKFGDEESAPFINGILDAVRLRLEEGGSEAPGRPGRSRTRVRTSA
jgi:N utilization substance protein B